MRGATLAWVCVILALPGAALAQQKKIVRTIPGVWIEISPTLGGPGIPLGLKADDEKSIVTVLGNAVFAPGIVWVGNNGGAGWGAVPDTDLDVPSEPLASFRAFGKGQSLLPYWDDIGNDTGDVYWAEVGGVLVIEWFQKHFEGKTTTATFQIQIPNTREGVYAQMLYFDIEQSPDALGGINATIGYQDGIGGAFNDVQWSFHEAFAVDNQTVLSLIDDPCPPDCNGDGVLNINDFICFKTEWDQRTPYGDYDQDGKWNIRDFIAFQSEFVRGCEG